VVVDKTREMNMSAYVPLDADNDTLIKEVIRQTQRANALEAQLMTLLEKCEYVRGAARHEKRRHEVIVTETIWSSFCAQLRYLRKSSVLADLQSVL
jgi:hypothetical protein